MSNDLPEISTILCPASVKHPRQTEASILPFEDGRLLLAYTDYYEGKALDESPARIMGKWSRDQGATWSAPLLLQENIGRQNVMIASLLALPSGRILLCFLKKNAQGSKNNPDLHIMLKHSDDQGATWSAPMQITGGVKYWCPANDRMIRLSTGRLLIPTTLGYANNGCYTWLSDDDGATWHMGSGPLMPPEGKNFEEPVVVELADGSLLMFIRTEIKGNRMQWIHTGRSSDGGETWTAGDPGPCSAYTSLILRRVPDSGDLLLIWNNHMVRSDLTSGISPDGGRTWKNLRLLEEQEDWPLSRSHTYPSLCFFGGHAHITYWEAHKHPQTANMFHLIYRRLPIAWFYEKRSRRPAAYDPARELLSVTSEYDGEETEHKV